MAMRTGCCLNLVPPNPPRSSPSKTSQLICRNKDESSRPCTRGACVVGMACLIVGMEMGTSLSNTQNAIIAKQVPNSEMVLAVDHEDHSIITNTSTSTSSENKVVKWSDKRMCPPWRLNSLETIVPENLPRPSASRRWEAVGHSYSSKDAPPVKLVVIRRTPSCFSM